MKKQLLIIGIIVLLICVGLSGCTNQQQSTQIQNKNPTSYEDKEFIDKLNEYLESNDYPPKIADGLQSGDYSSVSIYAKKSSDLAQECADDIDNFIISPKFEALRTEYKAAFENESKANYYTHLWAEAKLENIYNDGSDYLELSSLYVNQATEHYYTVNSLLPGLGYKNINGKIVANTKGNI